MAPLSFSVIIAILSNILSVVGIVICNKYITEVDGYNFMVFLSFLHFAFTTLGAKVMLQLGVYSYHAAPLSGVMPVAIGRFVKNILSSSRLNQTDEFVCFTDIVYYPWHL